MRANPVKLGAHPKRRKPRAKKPRRKRKARKVRRVKRNPPATAKRFIIEGYAPKRRRFFYFVEPGFFGRNDKLATTLTEREAAKVAVFARKLAAQSPSLGIDWVRMRPA